MKKILINTYLYVVIPIGFVYLIGEPVYLACIDRDPGTSPPPGQLDAAAKCVSLSYTYQDLFSDSETVYFAFSYPQVKLVYSRKEGYFRLSAIHGNNDLEIQIESNSLRPDSNYLNPSINFYTRYEHAVNTDADFILCIDSVGNGLASGSFSGYLSDNRHHRLVKLTGEFTDVVLQ